MKSQETAKITCAHDQPWSLQVVYVSGGLHADTPDGHKPCSYQSCKTQKTQHLCLENAILIDQLLTAKIQKSTDFQSKCH